ncbi:terminase large subunit domain-containing protein [Primorskyibacter sp. S87]|uniref:terminase large subunit domain-containing protein n=1 Tax=Primorskyibacter sp. S87 TaxID=3415126 RepID=UPI003C7D4E6F
MSTVNVNIQLRSHQLIAHAAETRFSVLVWHRRAGKTFYVIAKKVARAIATKRHDYRAFYIAPSYKQAKAISWDYIKAFTKDIPGTKINEAELRVDLFNGARIQLLGAEQYDSLRGRYADDLTLDETALIPSVAWTTVLSPMLADRKGRATFIGTPAGRMNLFHDLWDYADPDKTDADPEWSRSMLTFRDTNVLDDSEIARMKRLMSTEMFRQELECSFDAALPGAYYATQMEAAAAENRITKLAYDSAHPVICAVDLGFADALAIWYAQQVGNTIQIFDYEEHHGMSLDALAKHWHDKPFPIDQVILPHDAKVRELGTGKSRLEILQQRGVDGIICRNIPITDGIEATRLMLARCYFDKQGCELGLEALRAYRSEYDDKRKVQRLTPLHDWSSHGADALRYLAVGIDDVTIGGWAPLDTSYEERLIF